MSDEQERQPVERLVIALRDGKQITNGPQSIAFYKDGTGRMWCDTPGCCDYDFTDMGEIAEYLGSDDGDEWEPVER